MKKLLSPAAAVSAVVVLVLVAVLLYFNHLRQKEADRVAELQEQVEAQKKANQDIMELAELDKQEMENEYQEFAEQYAEMRARIKNDSLAKKLAQEQEKTERLLKQLKEIDAKDYPGEIARLKKELATCRAVIRSYVLEIDSLNRINESLRADNDRVRGQYEEVTRRNEALSGEKAALSEKVAIAAQLDATGINLTMKDKKNKAAKKIKNCKTLQVDFALARNVTATSGSKTVYVVVKSPEGATIGNAGSFSYENRTLSSSAKKTVEYGGEETPVTLYLDVNEALEAGTYHVSIFCDGRMIGSRSFSLN